MFPREPNQRSQRDSLGQYRKVQTNPSRPLRIAGDWLCLRQMSVTNDSSSPGPKRLWVLVALGLLLIMGLIHAIRVIGSTQEAGPPATSGGDGLPPAAVYVESLQSADTFEVAKVTGTLRARARAEVAAREAGAVVDLLADEGQHVQRGDVLAQLDDRRTRAQLTEAEAALTVARTLVSQREAEWARAEEDLRMKQGLLERRAISKSDVLDAERALAVSEAQRAAARDGVNEAQSRVDFLTIQVDDLTIRAPFSGTVVEFPVDRGEWVAVGARVATIVDASEVEAWLRVPTRFSTETQASPDAIQVFQSSTGIGFTPSKVTLVPDVEPLSQLFTVVATIDNASGSLRPGESITGVVPVSAERPHWHFPVDALNRGANTSHVFVVGPDNTAKHVPVDVAFEREGSAFVLPENSTLTKADRIVVEGNERLQPQQPLMIREREEASAP